MELKCVMTLLQNYKNLLKTNKSCNSNSIFKKKPCYTQSSNLHTKVQAVLLVRI